MTGERKYLPWSSEAVVRRRWQESQWLSQSVARPISVHIGRWKRFHWRHVPQEVQTHGMYSAHSAFDDSDEVELSLRWRQRIWRRCQKTKTCRIAMTIENIIISLLCRQWTQNCNVSMMSCLRKFWKYCNDVRKKKFLLQWRQPIVCLGSYIFLELLKYSLLILKRDDCSHVTTSSYCFAGSCIHFQTPKSPERFGPSRAAEILCNPSRSTP